MDASTSPNVYPRSYNPFRFHTCRLPHSIFQWFFLHRCTSLSYATRPLLGLVPSHLPDFNVPIEVLHAGICPRPSPHGAASVTHRAQDVSKLRSHTDGAMVSDPMELLDVNAEFEHCPRVSTTTALPASTRPVWVLDHNPSVRTRWSELPPGDHWTYRVCRLKMG